jgi:hypothetical protein
MSDDEAKTIWDIPGVGKMVAGIKTELMRVSPNETVVHVQFPPGTPKDRSAQFAAALRREFPPKVRMAFTTPGVHLNVMRAREVNLIVKNTELSMQEAVDRIAQVLEDEADVVNITLEGVKWKK